MIRRILHTVNDPNYYILRVKTDNAGTSASNQYTLPIGLTTYDINIKTVEHDLTGVTGQTTLTFSTAGTYDINIIENTVGGFPCVNNFGYGQDKEKIIDIMQWGTNVWADFRQSYRGCINLTQISATDAPKLTNIVGDQLGDSFRSTGIDFDFANWDTSTVVSYDNFLNNADNQRKSLAALSIVQATSMGNFMVNATGLSTANYDDTLVAWEAQLQLAYPSGVGYPNTILLHMGGSTYTSAGAGGTARASLIANFGWTITDGGGI